MASKNKKLSIAADILSDHIEGTIRKIPLKKIKPNEDQPRKNVMVNIEQLSNSLKEEGLLQPIVVKKEGDLFQIIAGERRFHAASLIGWEEIECRILNKNTADTYRLAVIENIQRENLDPIEEAEAYKKLKNYFSYTDMEMSGILGKSRNYISEILSIADIPELLQQKAITAGIDTRNLLIQFALAVKNGSDEKFLADFKSGIINSVKTAKTFIKNSKKGEETKEKPIDSPPEKNIQANPSITKITAQWKSENQIKVVIDLDNMKGVEFPLSQLEEKLNIQVVSIIKELSQ